MSTTLARRVRMRWLFTLVFALASHARWVGAADGQRVLVEGAVEVAIPPGFREVPSPPLPAGSLGTLLHTFNDGVDPPLSLSIQTAPASANAEWAPRSEETLRELARGFAAGMPGAYEVTTGAYDADRAAIGMRFKLKGPSRAHQLLSLPDTAPFWSQELPRASANPSLVRCLLDGLLAGGTSARAAELGARHAATGVRCGMSSSDVAQFVAKWGADRFDFTAISFWCNTFATRESTVQVLLSGLPERTQDAEAAAAWVWSDTRVLPGAEPTRPAFDKGRLLGVLIGASLGSVVVAGGFAWLLLRGGIKARTGLAVVGALLIGLCLFAVAREAASLESLLRVGASTVALAVAYVPLARWLTARHAHTR